MSTKIFNAFRVRVSKPQSVWALLWKIQDQAEANIRTALREHYLELVRQMDSDSPEYREAWANTSFKDELPFRVRRARDLIRAGYKKNSTELSRDTYSLDVTVAVYPYGSRVYLRTFAESISVVGGCLDFVAKMPELEDFHYQNQTDRPDDVTEKDWATRRRVWDGITAYQDVGRHVTLEILNYGSLWRLDPIYDLAREWKADPPKLPSREEIWAETLSKLDSLKGVTLQVQKGLIRAPARFTIEQIGDEWIVIYLGQTLKYPTLNQAADYVHFEHLPESTKEMVRHLMANAKEQERVAKG